MKNINLSLNRLGKTMGLNIEALQREQGFKQNPFSGKSKEIGFDLLNELVKLMKGEIKVKKEAGEQTTFLITIPSEEGDFNSEPLPLFVSPNKKISTSRSKRPLLKKKSFIEEVRTIVEENIEDEEFGITELCQAVLISRSQLHNKIKAQTGLSTSIFIRSIRIEKAKYLLENTDLNISEVAYQVGYKDPSYFSRLFTETYKVSPSKARKRLVVSYRRDVLTVPLVRLTS